MKLDHLLTSYTRINSNWIKDINVRLKIIKILQENTDTKISNISCSNIFSDILHYAREIKEKLKRQPNEWENIFANDRSDKKLISKIYLKTYKTQYQKQSNFFLKMEQTCL